MFIVYIFMVYIISAVGVYACGRLIEDDSDLKNIAGIPIVNTVTLILVFILGCIGTLILFGPLMAILFEKIEKTIRRLL